MEKLLRYLCFSLIFFPPIFSQLRLFWTTISPNSCVQKRATLLYSSITRLSISTVKKVLNMNFSKRFSIWISFWHFANCSLSEGSLCLSYLFQSWNNKLFRSRVDNLPIARMPEFRCTLWVEDWQAVYHS